MITSNHSSGIRFGYNVFFDTGASREGGSIKIALQSSEKDNENIAHYDGTVCPGGIENSDKYVKGIADHIAETVKKAKDIQKLNGDDKFLQGIVGFVPGQTIKGEKGFTAPILANLKDANKESLKNVDYSIIPSLLQQRGITLATNKPTNIETNDMMGAVLGIANKHANELNPGFFGALFMTGGGFGAAYMEVLDIEGKNYLHIKASESGHNREAANSQVYEKQGASVPALIGNFCKELNLDQENDVTKVLKDIGDARIVTSHKIEIDKNIDFENPKAKFNNKSQRQILEESNIFDISENGDKNFISLKNNKNLQRATSVAVNKYVDSMAHLAHIKVNEGYNKIFLTGPLAVGINKYLEANGENLADSLKQKTDNYLDKTGKNMKNIYKFETIVDSGVKDNTIGGRFLLKGKFNGNRGNSFLIPINDLK